MNATLNLFVKLLAFSDAQVNSNPRLRSVDWDRECGGIAVEDPTTVGIQIPVGATQTIFNGSHSITSDNTTAYSLESLIKPENSSTYRITHTGGTNPTFRTGRNLTLNTCVLTFDVQANNMVNLSVTGGSDFTNMVAGDYLFLPGVATGDSANDVNTLNIGYWLVVAKSDNTHLVITRPSGVDFEGVSELATITSNSHVVGFSSAGVQIGDSVALISGWATASLGSYVVTGVTDSFVEFTSLVSLPSQTGVVPSSSGLLFFTNTKSILYLEVDQDAVLQFNGDTGVTCVVNPIEPGNPDKPGVFLKSGILHRLDVKNTSAYPLNVLVVTAE